MILLRLLFLACLCAPAAWAGTVVPTTTYTGTTTVTGPDTITMAGGATVIVASTANVTYLATDSITLGPDFTAVGGSFSALIGTDTEAPTVPGSPGTSAANSTSLTFSWSAASDNVGVTGYEVSVGGNTYDTTTNTSLVIASLMPSTTYSFSVKARDAAGNGSGWSNPVNGTTTSGADTQAPSVPGNVATSAPNPTYLTLAWSAATDNVGVTGYEVSVNGSYYATTANTTLTIAGLAPSTGYTFSVQARDAADNGSGGSSPVGGTTTANPGSPFSQALWLDTNADGILDRVAGSNTTPFSFFIYSWSTANSAYTNYPVNSFFTPVNNRYSDQTYPGYSLVWQSGVNFWTSYTTHFDVVFLVATTPDRPTKIYRDRTALADPDPINPANWELVLDIPGLPGSYVVFQTISHSITDPNVFNRARYFAVEQGLPVGGLQLTDLAGNVLAENVTAGGTVELFLPVNGQFIVKARDTQGTIIGTASDLGWRIVDAVGNVLKDWATGDILPVTGIDSDTYFIQIKRGLTIASIFGINTIKPTLEPITTAGGVPPRNPSGFELGTEATFELKLNLLSGVEDETIVWSATGGVSFVGGDNKGKFVTVSGTSVGPATLEVQVGNFTGPKPTVTTNVYIKNVVPFRAYVVRNNNGGNAAATQAQITTMVNRANLIYRQAAMEFVQQGAIRYIDKASWLTIHPANDYADGRALTSWECGTGGLEIYFVNDLQPSLGGLHIGSPGSEAGLIINSNLATINTLAHELGHACDLADIYIDQGSTTLPNDKVRKSWLLLDWNNGPDAGPAYYDRGLTQRDLVSGRLLMYGTGNASTTDAIVIPRGPVYGVRKTAPNTGVLDSLSVGQSGLNRNPQHP